MMVSLMRCPATKLGFFHCDEILNICESLIDQQGAVSFKYSELMKNHGISPTTFYKYFSRKEDVLICLFLRTASSNDIVRALSGEVILKSRLMVLIPVVTIFEIMRREKEFNKIRAIITNGNVWKVASDERIKHFSDITNFFLKSTQCLIENAKNEGEFIGNYQDASNLAQVINRFIYGTITLAESGVSKTNEYLIECNPLYSQIISILNGFEWKEPFEMSDIDSVRHDVSLKLLSKRSISCQECSRTYESLNLINML